MFILGTRNMFTNIKELGTFDNTELRQRQEELTGSFVITWICL